MYVVDAEPFALLFGPPQGVAREGARFDFVKIKGVWSAEAFDLAPDRVKDVFQDPDFLKLFTRPYTIDRSFPIKYVAGYSNDGSTIYLDCDLPDEFELDDGTMFDAAPYIVFHERVEKALIDLKGYSYQGSHQIAMGAEGAAYQAAGLDWEAVKRALWPFVVYCVKKPLGAAPAELDMTPYLDTNRDIPEGMDKPNAQKNNPNHDEAGRFASGEGDGPAKFDMSKFKDIRDVFRDPSTDELTKNAIFNYFNNEHGRTMNDMMRGRRPMDGAKPASRQLQRQLQPFIGAMKGAFDKYGTTLDAPLTVYRGADYLKDADVGEVMQDLGFVSTTYDREHANDFSDHVAAITVPAGTRVLYSSMGYENEVLLQPGTRFKVVSKHGSGLGMEVV